MRIGYDNYPYHNQSRGVNIVERISVHVRAGGRGGRFLERELRELSPECGGRPSEPLSADFLARRMTRRP